MGNKTEITIKINITTHKKLLKLKKYRGSTIKWLVDSAVEQYYCKK